jgi:hypothetical protein
MSQFILPNLIESGPRSGRKTVKIPTKLDVHRLDIGQRKVPSALRSMLDERIMREARNVSRLFAIIGDLNREHER